MTPDDIGASDSGKLIVRLEGRLAGLEAFKAKTLAEIDRVAAESDRAREDIGSPFAQAGKLDAARDRVRQIDEKMNAAAAPPRTADPRPATVVPDWAATALKNPDDPRWLAAAAMHDAGIMAAVPGASVIVTYPEAPQSAAQTASLDFPVGNPVAGTRTDGSQLPARPAQPPSRGPAPSP